MKNPNYFGQKYDLVATIPVCIGDYVHRQTFLGPGLMSKNGDIIMSLKSDDQYGIRL